MTDLLLQYRACGAECRDDYLRDVANENGLPLACGRARCSRLQDTSSLCSASVDAAQGREAGPSDAARHHAVVAGDAHDRRWRHMVQPWTFQQSTPLVRLARMTGLTVARLDAIEHGDRVSRDEIDALARAWSVSAEGLIGTLPDRSLVVD